MARTTLRATLALLACAMIFLGGGAAPEKLYTRTFQSVAFSLGPGDVCDRDLEIEMPKGHIALRSFNAHVVDEDGVPVPLHETYLHHWTVHRFYRPTSTSGIRQPVSASNWGVCGGTEGTLTQLYGLGSETRRTDTNIPAPYGIEVGNPESVPVGYDEVWTINVHAIDTRGAVDKRGCTECICDLYNITTSKRGLPIREDYEGGLECCYDNTHCVVKEDFDGPERPLHMEYFVKWVDMSVKVVPVKVYILDVTDKKSAANGADQCAIEYTVPKCVSGESTCIHKAENVNFLPKGGDVIYAVAHQHSGGIGSTLYNSDGSEICASIPTYGNGSDAGDESGYIVGMSACFPTPGQVKVRRGEGLRLTSWYNNEDRHTGVMSLFYIIVDDSLELPSNEPKNGHHYGLFAASLVAAVILVGAIVSNHLKVKKSGPEYENLRV